MPMMATGSELSLFPFGIHSSLCFTISNPYPGTRKMRTAKNIVTPHNPFIRGYFFCSMEQNPGATRSDEPFIR